MNDSNHLSMKPSRERQQPFVAADTLAKALDRLQEYMELRQMYHAAMREMTTKLKNLDEEFCIRFDRNPIHHIESRLKSTESIIGKMKAKDCEIFVDSIRHNITDLAGVRVICHYLRDVETLAEMLLKRDDIELVYMRNYIQKPKNTGYRSLHLVVSIPVCLADRTEQVPVEVQIRTVAMDFWACLEHQLRYKSEDEVPVDLRAQLKDCARMIAEADEMMQEIFDKVKSIT